MGSGDLLKSSSAFIVYQDTMEFQGSLTSLKPGDGYLFKTQKSGILTFNISEIVVTNTRNVPPLHSPPPSPSPLLSPPPSLSQSSPPSLSPAPSLSQSSPSSLSPAPSLSQSSPSSPSTSYATPVAPPPLSSLSGSPGSPSIDPTTVAIVLVVVGL